MGIQKKTFDAGAIIFSDGDSGDLAYLIQTGEVEIFKEPAGQEVVLSTIGPNGIFGEMALIDDRPRMASARAITDTVCLTVPTHKFQEKLAEMDPFMRGIWQVTCSNLRSLTDRYMDEQGADEDNTFFLDGDAA